MSRRGPTCPGLERLIEDVQKGGIDVVVVERADRLHRDMQQFQATLELLHTHGVRFIAAREGLDLPS